MPKNRKIGKKKNSNIEKADFCTIKTAAEINSRFYTGIACETICRAKKNKQRD